MWPHKRATGVASFRMSHSAAVVSWLPAKQGQGQRLHERATDVASLRMPHSAAVVSWLPAKQGQRQQPKVLRTPSTPGATSASSLFQHVLIHGPFSRGSRACPLLSIRTAAPVLGPPLLSPVAQTGQLKNTCSSVHPPSNPSPPPPVSTFSTCPAFPVHPHLLPAVSHPGATPLQTSSLCAPTHATKASAGAPGGVSTRGQ